MCCLLSYHMTQMYGADHPARKFSVGICSPEIFRRWWKGFLLPFCLWAVLLCFQSYCLWLFFVMSEVHPTCWLQTIYCSRSAMPMTASHVDSIARSSWHWQVGWATVHWVRQSRSPSCVLDICVAALCLVVVVRVRGQVHQTLACQTAVLHGTGGRQGTLGSVESFPVLVKRGWRVFFVFLYNRIMKYRLLSLLSLSHYYVYFFFK